MHENLFQRAIRDPGEVFAAPEEVILHEALTTDQKRQVLERWAFDLRSLEVAEAENMQSAAPPRSGPDRRRVIDALHRLDEA